MQPIRYFKGLDIARFLAAAAVVLAHARFQLFQLHIEWHNDNAFLRQGAPAVTFFFTLSGFLLTCLGIQEYSRYGFIQLKKFYYRRVLRIWPLYYFTVLLCFITGLVLLPAFYPSMPVRLPMPVSLICTLFFIPNYLTANGLTNFGAVSGLWSIGVEELFYLLFPLLFLLYKKIKSFPFIFLLALVLQLCLHISLFYIRNLIPAQLVRFLASYVFHYMLLGAVAAALWMQCREKPHALRWFNLTAGLLGLAAVLVAAVGPPLHVLQAGMVNAVWFSAAILFIAQLNNNLFNNNPLAYFGKISYGIYLLHPFVSYLLRGLYARSVFFANAVRQMPGLYFTLLLALSILAAHFSYRWLELRFLKLKEKAAAV